MQRSTNSGFCWMMVVMVEADMVPKVVGEVVTVVGARGGGVSWLCDCERVLGRQLGRREGRGGELGTYQDEQCWGGRSEDGLHYIELPP